MPCQRRNIRRKRDGFVLITLAVCIVALVAAAGLAVDIGRMYIAKNETQTYADSASLAATLELDGTQEGLDRARAEVARNQNRWNFATSSFSNYAVTFARQTEGPYVLNPDDPKGYKHARVVATVELPLTFLSIFYSKNTSNAPMGLMMFAGATAGIRGDSAAGQLPKTKFKDALFPFSPFAHNPADTVHAGLTVGRSYTLRWAANPRTTNVCEGDNVPEIITLAEAGGGAERGFIEETGSSVIRQTIVNDYQTVERSITDVVHMTGGAKQTQRDAIIERINQDTNANAPNYAAYVAQPHNGRRIIAAPINSGYPDYKIVQIGAFLLPRVDQIDNGGNSPFCAEYIGAWVQGSKYKAADEGGAWVAKLTK